MKNHLFAMAMILTMMLSTQTRATLGAQILVNGDETPFMEAGKPAELAVDFFNSESSEPLHHFHPMHEREVHLIVVSDDLESFAHIHPNRLSEHLGLFSININAPTDDPYNLDASRAVLKAGSHFVFAEAMPMGFSMSTIPMQIEANGLPQPSTPLVLDPVGDDGFIYKEVNNYRFKLKVKPYPHCGTFSALFEIDLQHRQNEISPYLDVIDLEPWLNSFAHTVIISEQGATAAAKNFVHLHAVWPLVDDPETERGPNLRVASDSHTPMREGVYKMWLQFKHQGSVQTIPFVINIKAPPIPPGIGLFCL